MNPSSVLSSAAYFYAGDDVEFYDATAQMTDRAYDLVHEVTTRSLESWMAQAVVPAVQSGWFLNLGCGTGAEALRLLRMFPTIRVVCVDCSLAMINVFHAKLKRAYGNESANDRVITVHADFRESGWADQVQAKVSLHGGPSRFRVALSVYAMHHLEPHAKGILYQQIFNLLEHDSVFINADLYSYCSPWLTQLAQLQEEQWIAREFSEDEKDFTWAGALLGGQRERLKEAWIDHLRTENRPLPISTPYVGDTEQGSTEVGLLSKAGFVSVEIAARLYQSAVLISEKRG